MMRYNKGPTSASLAWAQLRFDRKRLAIAIVGVLFAVVLIFMQLGFRGALFESAVRYHRNLRHDLVMISPKTTAIIHAETFPRSRLMQALGFEGVETVSPIYVDRASWKSPLDPRQRRYVFVVGFDPSEEIFDIPEIEQNAELLKLPIKVLYDEKSRPEFGPIPTLFRKQGEVPIEAGSRRIEVAGLFALGTSFGIDANIVTSDLNFQRIFPDNDLSLVSIGLIRLEPDADAEVVRSRLAESIPLDVDILTRDEFAAREIDFWKRTTPIGFVFSLGLVVGLLVGGIIVYQVLFTDVSAHLREYATLKAMGYSDGFLCRVVLAQSVILAILGYLPGLVAARLLYGSAGEATGLRMAMDATRILYVLGLTVLMCAVSALLALRKLRTADPAEIF